MVDFVKKKIVDKLARFTKDLKPSDISLNFLSGRGQLYNLELNVLFITEVLQLPPWIKVTRVVCDKIRGHVPFTSLRTEPITFYAGTITIEVSTCSDSESQSSSSVPLKKIGGGKPSKYGFTEKVIDGMRLEIRSIVVRFRDPTFHAQLEMSDIVIKSTTPQWTNAQSLAQTRHTIADEDSVIVYKMVSWTSLKLEGWNTSVPSAEAEHHNSRIRLLSERTHIKIALKRNLSDSSIMATKITVMLGDIIWILTQSQLRALSKLVQSLMQAAVKVAREARLERERQESDRESVDSFESIVSTVSSEPEGAKPPRPKHGVNAKGNKKISTKKSLSANERVVKQRITGYREGLQEIPPFEVIQDSFHLHSGHIELQLCDDMQESHIAQGSMLLEICQLVVDVYFNQQAGSGRAHWNECNENTSENRVWSRELIQRASRTQFMDFPSIDLIKLRERGIVIKCADFSVSALKSGQGLSTSDPLPIITCDKKTFNIPEDIYNPAFQIGLTFYQYPLEYSSKFSAPRPNVSVFFTPLHVNVDQLSCLWLVEFVYGVVKTVNMELALSVHDEGKSYMESQKMDADETYQLPGVDCKIRFLYTKITVPLPGEVVIEDGRPKALQVETGAIFVENCALESLLADCSFKQAIQGMKGGWVFETQGTNQFPHFTEDIQSLPSWLWELIDQALQKEMKKGTSPVTQRLGSDEERSKKLDLATVEGWHIHTACVHVSFVDSYTQEATLYTTQFVDDFPIHVWLFPPQQDKDSTLSSTPSTPTLPSEQLRHDPWFSFLAHAPDLIRVELDRAQLLFLMRLKDSIAMFKNKLMEFLDTSTFVLPKRETSPSASSKSSSGSLADSITEESKPKTISGCVTIEHVQANILLPSIFTTSTSNSSTKMESPTSTQPKGSHDSVKVSDSDVTPVEPSTTIPDVVSPVSDVAEETDNSNQAVSQQEHSPAVSSISSLSVTVPTNLAQMSSCDRQSVISLPLTSNVNTNLTDLGINKAHSFSSLPEGSISTPPASLPSISNRSISTPPALLISTQVDLPSSAPVINSAEPASGSPLDDYVMIESPIPQSTHSSQVDITVPPPERPMRTSRNNRRMRSPPPLSERKVRALSPPKNEPEYILCISVKGIHALPNIHTSGAITARCNVNSIEIREVKKENYDQYKEQSNSRILRKEATDKCVHPVIKVRVEVGDQVNRFFSKSVDEGDVILIMKATGLEVGLLMQNIEVLKDFFNDEFEAELPVPIHVRVDNTKLVILNEPADSIDNWKSMCIEVNQADIHRGKSLAEGVNIFMDGGQVPEAPDRQLSAVSDQETTNQSDSREQSQVLQESNAQLVDSFKSFINTFEVHMKLHGTPLLQEHITSVLAELQTSMVPTKSENIQPPPSYSEAVSVVVTSHLQSSSDSNTEVIRLRRENEELRQLQLDRDKLNTQLVNSQSKLEQNMLDLDMVTQECKKAKQELVTYKQVLEKQNERMESLLSENFDLKRRLGH